MKMINSLLIIILCVSIGIAPVWSKEFQADCDKIEIKIETENTSNGLHNGKIKVNLTKGDKKSAKYIFCETSGKVLNENRLDNDSLEGLKKGNYICIISTSDCSKKINFTID
jgi:hypothetical protein